MLKKGFTLIELLVVIGLLAVIAAGVIALIDPLEKTRQANDANAINAIAQYATAMQSSAAQDINGYYPQPDATTSYDVFVLNGELKTNPVLPSTAYTLTYSVDANPATQAIMVLNLVSKKYTSKCTAAGETPYWYFYTENGRTCGGCAGAVPTTGAGNACGVSPPW